MAQEMWYPPWIQEPVDLGLLTPQQAWELHREVSERANEPWSNREVEGFNQVCGLVQWNPQMPNWGVVHEGVLLWTAPGQLMAN